MKREQAWQQEKGTFYASNRQRKLAYRRTAGGPWEPAEPLDRAMLSAAERVGWDKIDNAWFAVYRAPESSAR